MRGCGRQGTEDVKQASLCDRRRRRQAHFTHAANEHAGIVIRNALFRLRAKVNDELIPRVTFTDPELAHVGLTEAQARERHKHDPRAALALSRQ